MLQASTLTLQNATTLMQMIDGLSYAKLHEVVDIRTDLKEHLQPFRSFILQQAQSMNIPADVPLSKRHRQAALKWESDVSPAIEDLRTRINSDGFMRRVKESNRRDGAYLIVEVERRLRQRGIH